MPSTKKNNKRGLRKSARRVVRGGWVDASTYANQVYGAQQMAASSNNNAIHMNQIRGGNHLPMSPASLEHASQGLFAQGLNPTDSLMGGANSEKQQFDLNNSIHLGGEMKLKRRGGRIGLEELIVPAGLLVANQLAYRKNMGYKTGRRSNRLRRSNRRR